MSIKVYVVNLDTVAEKDLTREQLEVMPLEQLKELATTVLGPERAFKLIDRELLNIENNVLICREDALETIKRR